jgi:hypothetical protein
LGNALYFFAQKKLGKFLAKRENFPLLKIINVREGWEKNKNSGGKKIMYQTQP